MDPGEFSPSVLLNLTGSAEEMLADWFNIVHKDRRRIMRETKKQGYKSAAK